jgi:POT family proton-dependent oligopeptide transporter
MSQTTKSIPRKTLFGHPVGLFVLFFTEMWERFSYYGMRAILTLYMITSVVGDNPGLGWDEAFALSIYGWYTMLVYVASIPGGILADKFIGQKKSVLIGGLILVAGHGILAVEATWAFFTGLILIVLGVGALKPNISTMVGGLYPGKDPRRDDGFYIFYIGINVGAFLASLLVGFIGETYGWHYGFGLAGIGMALGQIVFMWGQKHLEGVGEPPGTASEEGDEETTTLSELFNRLFKSPVHLIITILLVVVSVGLSFYLNEGGQAIAYSLLGIFISVVIGVLMMIYLDINAIEKDRFIVLLISFLIVIVFWGAFEQAGGLMNIYTLKKIDRVVSVFVIDGIFIIAGLAMLILGIRAWMQKKDAKYIYFPIALAILIIYGVSKYYGLPDPYEIPAAVFQSLNPMYIIIFSIPVAAFWVWWRKQGWESSSLFKMAVGTVIMGTGFLFMAQASVQIEEYGDKAALYLLVLAYLLHTLGELCASPVALSFITKLAPVKYVSVLMGVYFAATGFGNKLAGGIGEAAQAEPIHVEITEEGRSFIPTDTSGALLEEFDFIGTLKGTTEDFTIECNMIMPDSIPCEGEDIRRFIRLDENDIARIAGTAKELEKEIDHEPTVVVEFEKDGQEYVGDVEVFEEQDEREFWTFISIFIFTAAFGILLILFLKKLKKLTHGAEDVAVDSEEQEGYDIIEKSD